MDGRADYITCGACGAQTLVQVDGRCDACGECTGCSLCGPRAPIYGDYE